MCLVSDRTFWGVIRRRDVVMRGANVSLVDPNQKFVANDAADGSIRSRNE